MKYQTLFILAIGSLLAVGCSTYKHKRTFVDIDGNSTTELTVYSTVFKDSQVASIKSDVMTNDRGIYTRSVGANGISALSDEDSIRVIEEVAGSVTRGIIGVQGGPGASLPGLVGPP